ncbi:glycosyltransferase family 29 protein [uncultured Aureimonas sp.]|uniref:glycosyltransferase family 29 protein n=1 Tax=uncultured Aureimonas sp. TaxID=1604662 RepID=UPI0025D90025|nr:glycosyltransferase family 29 protein [uncultured Aureimonas sp.]
MSDTPRGGPSPLRRTPRRIAIVGNAPELGDCGAAIDAADWVVRFNNAAGFRACAGRRVTHLALVNHGGQMREWLEDPRFLDRPAVRAAETFLFPFPRKPASVRPENEDGRDWTDEAKARLGPLGRPITLLPATVHREAAALIHTPGGAPPPPSTGFLVSLHLLRRYGGMVEIDVYGFGFAGWDGHDWARERRWFEAMAAGGLLRLHPLATSLAA